MQNVQKIGCLMVILGFLLIGLVTCAIVIL